MTVRILCLALLLGCSLCTAATEDPGRAALFDAIRTDNAAQVSALLDAGVAVDSRYDNAMTPLIRASAAGQTKLLPALLAHGAQLDAQDDAHYNAMDYAMEGKHYEVVLLLLQADAERQAHDASDRVALAAVLAGTALPSGSRAGRFGAALLLIAAARGDRDNAAQLLRDGLGADAGIERGYSALAMAARWNRAELVAALLRAGADPNGMTHSRYRSTALIEAARDGLVPIAKLLIAAGARVDQGDAHGDHALNWAAYFGHADFVALMIEMGADLHRTGQTDDQPIEIAIRERHPDVVQLLRAAGAVPRAGKEQSPAVP